jgi:decaprenylphospho-beta-D-erythro-pentofuranosid-2-ulose 2-reductase
VVLAGRDEVALAAARAAVESAGATDVRTVSLDAADTASHDATVAELFADGDVDVVLLAFGLLGDQAEAEADPDRAVEVAEVNYVGALSLGLRVANALRRQGHGTIVVLSSVAGERARRSNFVYGSSKAGLDAFAHGLADATRSRNVAVIVVRPGFVRSKMTTGLAPAPFATDPATVGAAVSAAVARGGSGTVWVPRVLGPLFAILRVLPASVWRRVAGNR